MAVIVTNRDKPQSCEKCWNSSNCELYKPHPSEWGYIHIEKDCPLKSTDEMIAEIHSLLDFWGRYKKNRLVYDILEVIDKYCGGKTDV